MRQRGVSLLVMLFPARYAARPATDEVTERLLAGRETPPGADASERALSRVLTAAARPGTEDELAGEAAAVAAFLHAAAPAGTRQARRARTRPRLIPGRVPVLAGGLAIAISVGLYGAAAANALPAPIQRWAHSVSVLHVPAPAGTSPGTTRPVPGESGAPTVTPTSSSPVPTDSPSAKAPTPGSSGKGKGKGKGNAGNGKAGNGKGNGAGGSGNSGNGSANGNAGSGNSDNGKGNGVG